MNNLKERDKLNKVPFDSKGSIIPKVGDVCFFVDNEKKCHTLCRIKSLIKSSHGLVRAVNAKTAHGDLTYPIVKLSFFESGHIDDDCTKGIMSTQNKLPSTRGAAVAARADMSKY